MSKDEIIKQLLTTLPDSKKVQTKDLNEKADKVEKCKDAATMVKEYENIICTKKKKIICQ